LKNVFQRGDRARRSSVGQTAVKRQLRTQPIGGAELRKPGTDAVIITRGKLVCVALEAAQLLESEGLWTYILL
jgi:transketolase C-terminal domain/subunit